MSDRSEGPLLDRQRIRALLVDLGRRCLAARVPAEMLVVGGGAMALAYSDDRATRDVDAVFEPKMGVDEVAWKMAGELGLPSDWLNDGVKVFLPDFDDDGEPFEISSEGIHVVVPSPGYLFAMKATAARIGVDDDDLVLLGRTIGVRSADEAYGVVERFYRRERVTAKAGFFIQTTFSAGPGTGTPGWGV